MLVEGEFIDGLQRSHAASALVRAGVATLIKA